MDKKSSAARLTCDHEGATLVLTIGETEIWAGSREEIGREFMFDYLLSALGTYTKGTPVKVLYDPDKTVPEALVALKGCPVIVVDWPDGSSAPLPRTWWFDLVEWICHLPKKEDGGGQKIGVFCQGGHGRTGTILAILVWLAGIVQEKEDPVEWVRENYCCKAVETADQIEYIEYVIGHEVWAEPSHGTYSAWTGERAYDGFGRAVQPASSVVMGEEDHWWKRGGR